MNVLAGGIIVTLFAFLLQQKKKKKKKNCLWFFTLSGLWLSMIYLTCGLSSILYEARDLWFILW